LWSLDTNSVEKEKRNRTSDIGHRTSDIAGQTRAALDLLQRPHLASDPSPRPIRAEARCIRYLWMSFVSGLLQHPLEASATMLNAQGDAEFPA
jgi:hypothetical protein